MATKHQHLSDAALIMRLVKPTTTAPDEQHERQTAHLDSCKACAARREELRRFTVTATSQFDWLDRITVVIENVETERASSDVLLDHVVKHPRDVWRAKLFAGGVVTMLGMVEALLARADAMINDRPAEALLLTGMAAEIAEQIRVDAYPFDLVISFRANAWREHAYSLFYVGRFLDAVQPIDRAEQLFRQLPAHDFDLARVKLIRANIYRMTERLPEAIPLMQDAASAFASSEDRQPYAKARVSEGIMLFQQGRIADALDVFKSLENEPALAGDVASAMVLNNIGHCCRKLDQLDLAADYFERAIALYGQFGAVAEIARTRWLIGQVLMQRSQFPDALPALREAWQRLEELSMETPASLAALNVVEVLLVLGETDEVPAICRTLLDRFTRNGMTSRAATALAYLREAVAAGIATPALVRHVHDFIRDIPQHPTRPFAPPAQL